MLRAAILSITIASLTALVGCEKQPTTTPDDAAAEGGEAEGGEAEGGTEETKPEEDGEGGW